MTITLQWEDEQQTILRYDIFAHWTADELEQRIDEAAAMMSTVNHPINIFVIVQGMSFMPIISVKTMRSIASAPTVRHPNFGGTIVLIGANPFITNLFAIFQTIAPQAAHQYRFVDTLAEAHAIVPNA